MNIHDAITLLKTYQGPEVLTLHSGADEATLQQIEAAYGITLPGDFKTLYRFCDGFEIDEDIFNLIPAREVLSNHRPGEDLQIAEYMIYSDGWYLWIDPLDSDHYEITHAFHDNVLMLTRSLGEFIAKVLSGSVFGEGGLYEWHKEVEAQAIYTTKLSVAQSILTVFYYGLRYDLLSKAEVVTWADRIVMHEDEPENLFVEMSVAHDKNALIALLTPVHLPDNGAANRVLLALLHRLLSSGKISIHRAVDVMAEHHFTKVLTNAEGTHIKLYTYQIAPDDEETNEEFNSKVLNFLSNYKQFTFDNFKEWFGMDLAIEYKWKKETETSPIGNRLSTGRQHKRDRRKALLLGILTAVAIIICIAIVHEYYNDLKQISLIYLSGNIYQLLKPIIPTLTLVFLITVAQRIFNRKRRS